MSKHTGYVSASQLNTFLQCPIKYRIIYVEKAVKVPPNIYMIYGSAIHEVLKQNFTQKIKTGVDLPSIETARLFSEYFRSAILQGYMKINNENSLDLEVQGINSVNHYIKDIGIKLKPLYAEKEITVKLNTYNLKFYGIIDLITQTGEVIDFKNVGRTGYKDYRQNYVDDLLQLTVYSLLYRKLNLSPEKNLQIHLIPRPYSLGAKIIHTTRTDLQVMQVVQLAQRIQEIENTGCFYPNFVHCKICDFKNSCNKLSY